MANASRTFLRSGRRGFTMVELLVAMAISSFIVITVFFVMTSSSRTFRVQSDVSRVSDRMNFALDTIKSDLRRTSFMTVPNAYLPRDQYPWYRVVCAPPPWMPAAAGTAPVAHALWVREGSGGDMIYYEPDDEDTVLYEELPDQLVMLGAFRTDRAFRPTQMQGGSSTLTVSNGLPGQELTDAQMAYIFDGATISVATPAGGIQYLQVASVAAHPVLAETVLTLSQALVSDPTGTGLETCNFTGFGGGTFEVIPLHYVRYSVVEDPDDRESTVLVREELNFAEQELATASRHIVARDIVDLQVWFDGVQALGDPNRVPVDGVEVNTVITDDEGTLATTLLAGNEAAEPENARLAYVQVSARLDTPITRFRMDGSGQGLAEFIELRDCNGENCTGTGEFTRVVTMRSEVDLPNIALANVRTGP